MAAVKETIQVKGIRCERCMARLGHVLKGHDGLESANATLAGDVTLAWDDEVTSRAGAPRSDGPRRLPRARGLGRSGRAPTPRESRRTGDRYTHC